MKLKVDPHSDVPIYRQMIDSIAGAIESGDLESGDKLPSIRELSTQLAINPNTTAKVYRELEIRGFVESRPGAGCFVQRHGKEAAKVVRAERMQELFRHVLTEAKARRIDEHDFLQFLKQRIKP